MGDQCGLFMIMIQAEPCRSNVPLGRVGLSSGRLWRGRLTASVLAGGVDASVSAVVVAFRAVERAAARERERSARHSVGQGQLRQLRHCCEAKHIATTDCCGVQGQQVRQLRQR